MQGCNVRLQFVLLAFAPWWHWAGTDRGASEGYKAAPQQRELCDCCFLPFAGSRTEGTESMGGCMSSAFSGISYRHWKAGIKLRCSSVWLNMREHTLPSCPCILALVHLCPRPNVCSGVSSYSCWAAQKMVCWSENIWGFNKMSGL